MIMKNDVLHIYLIAAVHGGFRLFSAALCLLFILLSLIHYCPHYLF